MFTKVITGMFLIFLAGTCLTITAQEENRRIHPQQRLRETLQLRQEMRRIEKEAIEKNPELSDMAEEIKALSIKLREKLDELLKTNVEYQDLKEQNEAMREDWKRRREEGKEGEKPRERRRKTD